MARKIVPILFVALIFILSIFITEKAYFFLSIFIIGCMMLPFFIRFEKRLVSTREIVLLAMFSAIAAISRIPFAALPSIQPTSFFIIIVGIAFGVESGFIVGVASAFISNLVLGHGPWTPWQMLAWGMMGMTAGMMSRYLQRNWARIIFGFIWGFLFGWLINLWVLTTQIDNLTLELVISIYVASFIPDLSHALSNVVLLLVFSSHFLSILTRISRKYHILDNSRYKN